MDATQQQHIADTIVSQLGGTGKLSAMIGAQHFGHGRDEVGDVYLSFKFKGCRKFNVCKVTYNRGNDTYTLKLSKFSMRTYKETNVMELSDVYANVLRGIIEDKTGLYLSL